MRSSAKKIVQLNKCLTPIYLKESDYQKSKAYLCILQKKVFSNISANSNEFLLDLTNVSGVICSYLHL